MCVSEWADTWAHPARLNHILKKLHGVHDVFVLQRRQKESKSALVFLGLFDIFFYKLGKG